MHERILIDPAVCQPSKCYYRQRQARQRRARWKDLCRERSAAPPPHRDRPDRLPNLQDRSSRPYRDAQVSAQGRQPSPSVGTSSPLSGQRILPAPIAPLLRCMLHGCMESLYPPRPIYGKIAAKGNCDHGRQSPQASRGLILAPVTTHYTPRSTLRWVPDRGHIQLKQGPCHLPLQRWSGSPPKKTRVSVRHPALSTAVSFKLVLSDIRRHGRGIGVDLAHGYQTEPYVNEVQQEYSAKNPCFQVLDGDPGKNLPELCREGDLMS